MWLNTMPAWNRTRLRSTTVETVQVQPEVWTLPIASPRSPPPYRRDTPSGRSADYWTDPGFVDGVMFTSWAIMRRWQYRRGRRAAASIQISNVFAVGTWDVTLFGFIVVKWQQIAHRGGSMISAIDNFLLLYFRYTTRHFQKERKVSSCLSATVLQLVWVDGVLTSL